MSRTIDVEFPVPSYGYALVFMLFALNILVNTFGLAAMFWARSKGSMIAGTRARHPFLLISQTLAFTMSDIVILFNFVKQPYPYCYVELIMWKIIVFRGQDTLAERGFVIILIHAISRVRAKAFSRAQRETWKDENWNSEEINNLLNEADPWWLRLIEKIFPDPERAVSNESIIGIGFLLWFITLIAPLVSVMNTAANNSDDLTENCEDVIVNTGNYITGIGGVAVDIIVLFMIRNCKDDLFLKKEIMILAISEIIGIFVFMLTFVRETIWIGYALVLCINLAIQSDSLVYVSIHAILEIRNDYSSSSRSGRFTEEAGFELSSSNNFEKHTETKDLPIFSKYPDFYNLFTSAKGSIFLFGFATRFQQLYTERLLLFIQDYLDFIEIQCPHDKIPTRPPRIVHPVTPEDEAKIIRARIEEEKEAFYAEYLKINNMEDISDTDARRLKREKVYENLVNEYEEFKARKMAKALRMIQKYLIYNSIMDISIYQFLPESYPIYADHELIGLGLKSYTWEGQYDDSYDKNNKDVVAEREKRRKEADIQKVKEYREWEERCVSGHYFEDIIRWVEDVVIREFAKPVMRSKDYEDYVLTNSLNLVAKQLVDRKIQDPV